MTIKKDDFHHKVPKSTKFEKLNISETFMAFVSFVVSIVFSCSFGIDR